MWHDYLFSQRKWSTERTVGMGVGGDRGVGGGGGLEKNWKREGRQYRVGLHKIGRLAPLYQLCKETLKSPYLPIPGSLPPPISSKNFWSLTLVIFENSHLSASFMKGVGGFGLCDKYLQHSSIIWPVWLNGWVFIYELSGCGFESICSHLNFRFCACFKQGVPWHSGNYRVWIHWNMYVTWQEHTVKCTIQISTHNTAQSFGQFG